MITPKQAANWKEYERGMFLGLPMDTYLKAPGANRSLLQKCAERPSHAEKYSEGSEAQNWGTLFNDLLFFGTRNYYVRPDTYESTPKATKADHFPVAETKPWNGNATVCKEWMEAHTDKPILPATGSHSEDWMNKALAKCHADPRIKEMLDGAMFEVTIFGVGPEEFHHPLAKCRPDIVKLTGERAIFCDLKTTIRGSTDGFSREIMKYGYHEQAAHCRRILASLDEDLPLEYYFLIVEKGDDPRVQLRQLMPRAMDEGDHGLNDYWTIYQRCRMSRHWPDFADEPEPHITGMIDLPDFVYPEDDDEITTS